MGSEALMTEWMPAVSFPVSPILFSAALGATAAITCGSLAVAIYRCVQWNGKGSNLEKIVQVKEQVCLPIESL